MLGLMLPLTRIDQAHRMTADWPSLVVTAVVVLAVTLAAALWARSTGRPGGRMAAIPWLDQSRPKAA